MRIIAGRFRGKRIAAPADDAIRPTTDRVRENLFNILMHVGFAPDLDEDACVLDAFCGTGALALEALSRGAGQATLMDTDMAALKLAKANIANAGAEGITRAYRLDATAPGPCKTSHPANLVFLDPPWRQELAGPAMEALLRGGWAKPDALFVLEQSKKAMEPLPANATILDERRFGEAVIRFVRAVPG